LGNGFAEPDGVEKDGRGCGTGAPQGDEDGVFSPDTRLCGGESLR
jgi:hypothetical protein